MSYVAVMENPTVNLKQKLFPLRMWSLAAPPVSPPPSAPPDPPIPPDPPPPFQSFTVSLLAGQRCVSFLSVAEEDLYIASLLDVARSLTVPESFPGGYAHGSSPPHFPPYSSSWRFTALCRLWELGFSRSISSPSVLIDSVLLDMTAHAVDVSSDASSSFLLVQIHLYLLTSVSGYMILNLRFPPTLIFAFVRVITAVCRLCVDLDPAFGASSFVSFSSWQVETEVSDKILPVNLVKLGLSYPIVSFTELFLFPIYLPLWSGLEVQALSVLQGSSSRLMLSTAFDAVAVTPRVTLDAVIQDAYEIVVLQFLMVFVYDLYHLSISRLTIFWWSFWHLLPCFHVFSFLLVAFPFPLDVFPPLSIEFEA